MIIFTPQSLKELLELKNKYQDATILAGGTDLVAQWHNTKSLPEKVISISQVKELRFIKRESEFIEIGSLINHTAIVEDKNIQKHLPVLSYAASTIGAPAIRNMGTIGGNIANASPAADLPPVLLIYDAVLVLFSQDGKREIRLSEFYRGYKNTALLPGEVIYSVKVPIPPIEAKAEFFKIGSRRAQTIAKVSLAGILQKEKKGVSLIRLAAGSIAPTPVRLYETERFLLGKMLTRSVISSACDTMLRYIKPITDVRSTEEYRRIALKNLLFKLLNFS